MRFNDPLVMPGTGHSVGARLAMAKPLVGTPGETYVERRGVPRHTADAAGVMFDPDFGGRAAVLVPLKDRTDAISSLHGRFLEVKKRQNKMLTIGVGNGTVNVLGGWKVDPLIIVEGLFDALSLATCGWASIATIGRWPSWLPEICLGRVVWVAFDATRGAETDFARYKTLLPAADVRRLSPPARCKDWNTALIKLGRVGVTRWLRDNVTQPDSGTS
jgi:hypothetical protein